MGFISGCAQLRVRLCPQQFLGSRPRIVALVTLAFHHFLTFWTFGGRRVRIGRLKLLPRIVVQTTRGKSRNVQSRSVTGSSQFRIIQNYWQWSGAPRQPPRRGTRVSSMLREFTPGSLAGICPWTCALYPAAGPRCRGWGDQTARLYTIVDEEDLSSILMCGFMGKLLLVNLGYATSPSAKWGGLPDHCLTVNFHDPELTTGSHRLRSDVTTFPP